MARSASTERAFSRGESVTEFVRGTAAEGPLDYRPMESGRSGQVQPGNVRPSSVEVVGHNLR